MATCLFLALCTAAWRSTIVILGPDLPNNGSDTPPPQGDCDSPMSCCCPPPAPEAATACALDLRLAHQDPPPLVHLVPLHHGMLEFHEAEARSAWSSKSAMSTFPGVSRDGHTCADLQKALILLSGISVTQRLSLPS